MLRKDIQQGQCFKYVTEPREAYYLPKYDEGERILLIHVKGWYLGQRRLPSDKSNREVELLEHYSTHPIPTPIITKSVEPVLISYTDPLGAYWDCWAAAHTMRDNDLRSKKATIGKITDKESKAWSAELRSRIEQQEAKIKKDKEIKVDLEFDYWE